MIGKKRFYANDKLVMILNLLEYCETQLTSTNDGKPLLPKVRKTKEETRIDELKKIYISKGAKKATRSDYFLDYRHFPPPRNDWKIDSKKKIVKKDIIDGEISILPKVDS